VCARHRAHGDWFAILVVWRAAHKAAPDNVELAARLREAEEMLDGIRRTEGIRGSARVAASSSDEDLATRSPRPACIPASSPAGELVDEMVRRLRGEPPRVTLPASDAGTKVSCRLDLGDPHWQREVMRIRLQRARDDLTYYDSSHWRTFTAQAKWDAGYECLDCGAEGVALFGHHITYDRLGEERTEDVVVVCEPCHDARHGRQTPNSAPRVAGLAADAPSALSDEDIPF